MGNYLTYDNSTRKEDEPDVGFCSTLYNKCYNELFNTQKEITGQQYCPDTQENNTNPVVGSIVITTDPIISGPSAPTPTLPITTPIVVPIPFPTINHKVDVAKGKLSFN